MFRTKPIETLSEERDCFAIERDSFGSLAWSEEDLHDALTHPANSTVIATVKAGRVTLVVGFLIYQSGEQLSFVVDVAVDPQFRRMGVGSVLFREMFRQSIERGCPIIEDGVPESDVAYQLFLKSLGFEWRYTIRNPFENGEDGYMMVVNHSMPVKSV